MVGHLQDFHTGLQVSTGVPSERELLRTSAHCLKIIFVSPDHGVGSVPVLWMDEPQPASTLSGELRATSRVT